MKRLVAALAAEALVWTAPAMSEIHATATVDLNATGVTIAPEIFGQFSEQHAYHWRDGIGPGSSRRSRSTNGGATTKSATPLGLTNISTSPADRSEDLPQRQRRHRACRRGQGLGRIAAAKATDAETIGLVNVDPDERATVELTVGPLGRRHSRASC
jgi:hypothetical protein